MTGKPAQDFNKKTRAPRLHVYSVSVRTKGTRKKDYTAETGRMTGKIKALAEAEGFSDRVSFSPEDSMAKIGILFMKAPEKFAALVRKLDGIQYVEKPADRKTASPVAKR